MKKVKVLFFIILSLVMSSCSKDSSSGDCYVKNHKVNGGEVGEVWHESEVSNGVVKYYNTVQIVSANYKSEPVGGGQLHEMSLDNFQKEINDREKIKSCIK
ncbi:MAG: hypothetical protein RIR56_867 [Bacteroidota bacterium]|jgi:hypothetical protein